MLGNPENQNTKSCVSLSTTAQPLAPFHLSSPLALWGRRVEVLFNYLHLSLEDLESLSRRCRSFDPFASPCLLLYAASFENPNNRLSVYYREEDMIL